MSYKSISTNIAILLFCLTACTKQTKDTTLPCKVASDVSWVHELECKNPLKDSANIVSVYFRFDTIVNNFEVSGILYPKYNDGYGWEGYESGARLFFHSRQTDKEYIWTNMDYKEEAYKPYFMSINVVNIICDKHFNGFKNGDAYIFRYDTTTYEYSDNNSLLPYAEYQFYDADFDGEDELILGSYVGGPHGSPGFEIYDFTDSELVLKKVTNKDDHFSFDTSTIFDLENKTITNILYCGACGYWGEYDYKTDEKGNLYLLYHVSFVSDTNQNIISDTTFYNQ